MSNGTNAEGETGMDPRMACLYSPHAQVNMRTSAFILFINNKSLNFNNHN
jgi:hypothetical protein